MSHIISFHPFSIMVNRVVFIPSGAETNCLQFFPILIIKYRLKFLRSRLHLCQSHRHRILHSIIYFQTYLKLPSFSRAHSKLFWVPNPIRF
ncbi:hypothetical protein PBCV1_a120L [Paramecium bursaria Chlorella virus 1]|uniref:Uncharacterized protein n=1 Tax=Paramecium bursaria Chlorella virus 1 TaxID=10506 RepID=Q84441_PBCV1|nr:hypothetical protein PBCV1_a120L [Paramecium bursaria Chlorella virus 1]AAC96488.1 hypothetical protein [Paramecium bursaria Chlorella virus 1]